jgi:hypothetical protein
MHTAYAPGTEFTLDESRLDGVAARYPIDTDHDALLALTTVVEGDRAGGPLLIGPCGIDVALLTDADGDIDGYRVILLPDDDEDAPGLASRIQRVSELHVAGYDTAGIIRHFVHVANDLLALHQALTAAHGADGIVLTRSQLRAWTGSDLTAADLTRLAMCIPASTIPGELRAIVSQAMGLPACHSRQEEEGARAAAGSLNRWAASLTARILTSLRFTAHFTPEAWQRDYAVEVDPEGPREWDCTAYALEHLDYLAQMRQAHGGNLDSPEGVLDGHDRFKADPAAPKWVRDWHGPYTIRITAQEES